MPPPLSQAPPARLRGRRVFLALEGGGAAGVVHVGALRAFEAMAADPRHRMRPVGYAGTSAGAMVAALAAVGYRANEMIRLDPDPQKRGTLLDELALPDGTRFGSATRLFGKGGWQRVTWVVWLGRHPRLTATAALLVLGLMVLAAWLGIVLAVEAWLGATTEITGLIVAAAAMAAALLLVGVVLYFLLARPLLRGLADTDTLREAFNEALRRKLDKPPGHQVRFEDLPPDVDLKIIATDITHGQLQLYSRATTPGTMVADAVAASVCLPVVFGPKRLDDALHFDGGLVSNLPAWPFDEERLLDPDAVTIAVAIDSEAPARPVTDTTWPAPTLRAAVFGSDVLNTRGVGRIEIIRLRTGIGVLDFDLSLDQVCREVEQQETAAKQRLDAQLLARPLDLHRRSAQVAILARRVLGPAAAGGVLHGRIRVAIALPEDHIRGGFLPAGFPAARVQSLSLRHGFGYRTSADEGLVVPVHGTAAGDAFLTGAPQFSRLDMGTDRYAGPPNRVRDRLVASDLAWVFCVPVPVPGPDRLPATEAPIPLDGVVVVSSTASPPPEPQMHGLALGIQALFV